MSLQQPTDRVLIVDYFGLEVPADMHGNDAPSDDDGLVIQMHAIFRPQQLAISRTPLPAEAGYHRPGSS